MSWPKKPLGEVADFQLGKMLDQVKNRGDSRPYLANKNVRWGSFDLSELREMLFEEAEFERFSLKNGDIVMCEGGEPGRCAIWREQLPKMMYQKALHRIRPYDGMDSVFLYYNLSHRAQSGHFNGLFTGATIKHLPREKLALVEVDAPDLPTQQRIAGILSAYDDLIENNRRRIGLLEQAARLLYREWFVRFRFPGHETAKFVDGLPEGWSRGIIADLFDTSSGGTPSRKNDGFYDGSINWLKTQELQNCFIYETDEKITEEGLKRSSAKLFPESTVVVAMYGATIGQLAILANPSSTNQACCALLPKREPEDYLFAYCLMEHSAKILKDLGQGAAQNNVSQQVIRSMDILIPSYSVLDMFNAVIFENFQQRRNLQAQNTKLTRARDLLLPRLMDGRIPV